MVNMRKILTLAAFFERRFGPKNAKISHFYACLRAISPLLTTQALSVFLSCRGLYTIFFHAAQSRHFPSKLTVCREANSLPLALLRDRFSVPLPRGAYALPAATGALAPCCGVSASLTRPCRCPSAATLNGKQGGLFWRFGDQRRGRLFSTPSRSHIHVKEHSVCQDVEILAGSLYCRGMGANRAVSRGEPKDRLPGLLAQGHQTPVMFQQCETMRILSGAQSGGTGIFSKNATPVFVRDTVHPPVIGFDWTCQAFAMLLHNITDRSHLACG